ncbi:hypothetical protein LTR62_000174 [Meristemomyces frigidus]|uniref:JmjC domain-containing protein n=1 Tax=Meristemomyces frigidus TaxID=1508187 RepID=A0AAN7YSY0_9PEZI|nr:hypothetical protein LTR62_000174 [Meristemomyces frigidus]
MKDPLQDLIQAYHELNAAVVEELWEEPSALEFMRYVAKNRPFVVRQAAIDWRAVERWDAGYLRKEMAGKEVNVAVTPLGNADAVVESPSGSKIFVEPFETSEPFDSFLDAVQASSSKGANDTSNARYAQTQNDNLRNEYSSLYRDVPADIPFARIALSQPAEAINLWLGNDRSVTSLHKDNYENIYVQIRGQKQFVLMPPIEMPCVNEQLLGKGRYATTSEKETQARSDEELIIERDANAEPVPVAIWDPDLPNQNPTPYSHLAQALRVTLQEGDLLYLPSLWYHKVSQSVGEEGFVCAVNYWYDMEFAGQHWVTSSLVRDVYWEEEMKVRYPDLDLDEEGSDEVD